MKNASVLELTKVFSVTETDSKADHCIIIIETKYAALTNLEPMKAQPSGTLARHALCPSNPHLGQTGTKAWPFRTQVRHPRPPESTPRPTVTTHRPTRACGSLAGPERSLTLLSPVTNQSTHQLLVGPKLGVPAPTLALVREGI